MTTMSFDTHKIVKELQEAGFDESQAEAVVAAIGTAVLGNVATKQDVRDACNEFKQDLKDARNEAKSDLKDACNASKSDLKDARNEAKSDAEKLGSELRAAMQAMELRITLRTGGMIAAAIGLAIGLDRLL